MMKFLLLPLCHLSIVALRSPVMMTDILPLHLDLHCNVSVEVGLVFVIFRDCGWCIDIDDECFLFVSCFDGY